jgi:hypothetical protein
MTVEEIRAVIDEYNERWGDRDRLVLTVFLSRGEAGDRAFRDELTGLINRYSRENGSDTPDFILADYLSGCLDNFDRIVRWREKWYGRERQVAEPQPAPPEGYHYTGTGIHDPQPAPPETAS